jgi:hypothetical protein
MAVSRQSAIGSRERPVEQADLGIGAKFCVAEKATLAMPLEGIIFSIFPQIFQHFIHRIFANGSFFLLRGRELCS